MKPVTEQLLAQVGTWALLLTATVALVACGKKAEKAPEQERTAVAAPEPAGPTADDQLSAMLRGHPNSRQVCIDGNRKHAYFLDYGPLQKPGEAADNQWHGWIFIEGVEFYSTSNNTYWIINQEDEKYMQAYPDVSGLRCRAQQ